MQSSELVILTARRLTLAQWQRAIDVEDFLVPLALDLSQPDEGSRIQRATLGGEAISFAFDEVDMAKRPAGWALIHRARYAFSTPGTGDIKSCAAGGMALLAYTSHGFGGFYEGGNTIDYRGREFKKHLDGMLAVAFDKTREYESRYPSRPDAGGGMEIVARRLQ